MIRIWIGRTLAALLFFFAIVDIIGEYANWNGVAENNDVILSFILLAVSTLVAGVSEVLNHQTKETDRLFRYLQSDTVARVREIETCIDKNLSLVASSQISKMKSDVDDLIVSKKFYVENIELFISFYIAQLVNFRRSTFYATSIPSRDFFWRSSDVAESTSQFIRGGGEIRRVFFLEEELAELSDEQVEILGEQKSIGVDVYVASMSRVPGHMAKFYMVETGLKIGWEPTRKANNSIHGITVYADEKKNHAYKDQFEELLALEAVRKY